MCLLCIFVFISKQQQTDGDETNCTDDQELKKRFVLHVKRFTVKYILNFTSLYKESLATCTFFI